MTRVEKAIESGRCAIAVGGALLKDPEVMLALTQRVGLAPMALAGPAVSPVVPISADAVSSALAQPGSVVVLVEPESSDAAGLKQLGELLTRARHRPDVIVVARSYNPFAFTGALTGLKVAHEKGRGKAFIQALPNGPVVDSPAGEPAQKAAKANADTSAPRYCYVGREELTATLAGLLGEGGPIVVSGPSGIGRTQLVEHALVAAGLKRVPDVWLGWGSGADALAARIAGMGREVDDNRLWDLLAGAHTPADVARTAVEVLSNEALKGRILIVHHLDAGLGREADFFRKSRLELLLGAILTTKLALPVVFLSTRQPVFHREGEANALRRLEVGGILGRFFHEIFDAVKAVELSRDKFGPISERVHGHPLAARTFAIATRVRQNGAELADDPKFLAMESAAHLTPLEKHLQKRVEKLPEALRVVLGRLAHLRIPVDGGTLANDLGVSRKDRIELLSLGLLCMIGTAEDRRYRVHPLVRAQLSWREVSDFDVSEKLAEVFQELAQKAEGLARQVLEHEQGRFAVSSRALKLRPRTDLPDHDMWLESITGMLRAKQPRLDLVEQRLAECLNQNPHNSDAWLLRLELASHGDKPEAIEAILDEAIAKAPVPELFQQATSYLMSRRQRARAIPLLERGVALFPNESRLRTRLAAVLMRQGRRNEAIDHLRHAMEVDPMLPDSYGLLGMARRDEGRDALPEAESLLREAVRLAPDDPTQTARLADLLLEWARVDFDRQEALRAEVRAVLEGSLSDERRAPESCLLLATLIREEGGDLERATWLLGQAKKLTDRGHERNRRIVVERALVDMARGDLDSAEHALRQHIAKDPSHARAFAALGHVLEAREQYIPAHAEYLRAKERVAQNGLEGVFYDQQTFRVQAIIEAQAQGLWTRPEAPTPILQPSSPSTRILRRRAAAAEPTNGSDEADASAEVVESPASSGAIDEPTPSESVEPA